MRIGLVQTAPLFGAVKQNLADACTAMASAEANLWVLPELFTTGYQFASFDELERLAESIPDGPTTHALIEFARLHDCAIAAGLAERDEGRFFTAGILVDPRGVALRYRKIHLFAEEKQWFSPGDTPFETIELEGVRVGLLICVDHVFPEAARTLALRGAEVIAHPANLVMPVYAQITMRTRALENGVFTVTANRIGFEYRTSQPLTFTGCSQIVSPDGTLLYSGPADTVDVAVVDVDPAFARDKALNRWNDRFADRRPLLYDARLSGEQETD